MMLTGLLLCYNRKARSQKVWKQVRDDVTEIEYHTNITI